MPETYVLGHKSELSLLSRAVNSGRTSHAYLFSGLEGIGKSLTARWLALVLNCEEGAFTGETIEACGRCKPCLDLLDGSSLNFIEIGPEKGYLKIERIRELQRELRFTVDSGWRVVVVDKADSMQEAASNAFLKTLEEPGRNTVIILVSSRPSLLLPTILSRCQRINFSPLSTATVEEILRRSFGFSHDVAESAASLSLGSVTRALLATEGGECVDRLTVLSAFLGHAATDAPSILKAAEKLAKDEDLVWKLELLKSSVRDMIVDGVAPGDKLPEGASSVTLTSKTPLGLPVALELFRAIEGAQRDIQPPRNANKRLALENLILELSAPGWSITQYNTA